MLIEFSVGNYRSIKDIQTLSFVATSMKEHEETHTFQATDKIRLLKSAAIYGANGSGKSNLIKAFFSMLVFIRDSFKDENIGTDLIEPFLLDKNSQESHTFFQIVFIEPETLKKYRYGFTYSDKIIKSEWLFGIKAKNEVEFFTRENLHIEINENSFKDFAKVNIKNIESDLLNKNLILNLFSTFGGKTSKSIKEYFENKIAISLGISDGIPAKTLRIIEDENSKKDVLDWLNRANTGITNLILEEEEINDHELSSALIKHFNKKKELDDKSKIFRTNIFSERILKDENNIIVKFDFAKNESEGTKKILGYSGLIIDAIKQGKVLILDEFDARLHPNLTRKIVQLFNSNFNSKNGQLFFATHDTNLLDGSLMRRDQIFFSEKNSKSETQIYSLSDFKGVRNDASFERDYMKGKYGATPLINKLENIFKNG